jgi:CDGSH-type Zn-finger protein
MSEPKIAGTEPIEVEVEAGKKYAWCTCGQSESQPFCDGKHTAVDMKPMVFTAEESGTVYLCTCKRTAGQPFCDGSHNAL